MDGMVCDLFLLMLYFLIHFANLSVGVVLQVHPPFQVLVNLLEAKSALFETKTSTCIRGGPLRQVTSPEHWRPLWELKHGDELIMGSYQATLNRLPW
ncbi:hypothetical protein PIB30_016548 [Stylosanthes scabra]|uniref:Secreted protein n=1 Tax=Stylosanthes scabra TaxID=79078 RepID=A0ABU6R7L4_9FABA|nr:hypothetical protein [Stylosanthes scabra]